MQSLRLRALSLEQARQFEAAMDALNASAIHITAEGTWIAGKELVFAGCTVTKIGRKQVRAIVDGETITMKPYRDASLVLMGEFQ